MTTRAGTTTNVQPDPPKTEDDEFEMGFVEELDSEREKIPVPDPSIEEIPVLPKIIRPHFSTEPPEIILDSDDSDSEPIF